MAATVGGKYRLINKIGYGSFGDIYQGADDEDCPVAIKLEQIEDSSLCVLKHEAAIYKALEDGPTIPKFLWYGSKGGYNILVMELLDKSLEELKHECGGTLSARTVLMLADQMISCLEYMHKKRIIHRDLKPENFMMRRGSGAGQVAIIDFGLSKFYVNPETGVHNPQIPHKSMTGTVRYASINAMKCIEQSRRDDLESLGYIFLYLLNGSLPWQGISAPTREEKLKQICEMKAKIPLKELCKGLPDEFRNYLEAVRSLGFEEEPKYADYRFMFRRLFLRCRFIYDYKYDWIKVREAKVPKLPIGMKLPKIKHKEHSSAGTNPREPMCSRRTQGNLTGRDRVPNLPRLSPKVHATARKPWDEQRHSLAHKVSAYVNGAIKTKYAMNKVGVA